MLHDWLPEWLKWLKRSFRKQGRTCRQQAARFRCHEVKPDLEVLETRTLLSSGSAVPVGFIPSQILHAYGIDQIQFGSVVGDGTGQTIAIINYGDDRNLIGTNNPNFDSLTPGVSDLNYFDATFNLPAPPSFTKINQNGGTALPPGTGGALEEVADVEWAHAVAPMASIILVEAIQVAGDIEFSFEATAIQTAEDLPNVSVISMSFGHVEDIDYDDADFDSLFTTPANHHGGITFVASTGDNGAPGEYPAYSPGVLAVGGTVLNLDNTNSIQGEGGWEGSGDTTTGDGSGGGISTRIQQPIYQQGIVTLPTTMRTIPDVAFAAGPGSEPTTGISRISLLGAAVYDTLDNGTYTGWTQFYGTSLGAPCWAGLIAIADQGRFLNGLPTLDGPTQTLPMIYALPSTDFHDITTGTTTGQPPDYPNYSAGPGYDLVTGRGSPVANLLVEDLAGNNRVVFGTVTTDDIFGDPLANVYIELNEPNGFGGLNTIATTQTDANGNYYVEVPVGQVQNWITGAYYSTNGWSFSPLQPVSNSFFGDAPAQGEVQADFAVTTGLNLSGNPVTVGPEPDANGIVTIDGDPTVVNGGITVSRQGDNLVVTVSGEWTMDYPYNSVNFLKIDTEGGAYTLTVNDTNGEAIPSGGMSFDAASVLGNNKLVLTGGAFGEAQDNGSGLNSGSIVLPDGTFLDYSGLAVPVFNQQPVPGPFSIAAGQPLPILDLRATDPQGGLLNYQLLSGSPGNISAKGVNGQYTWTPLASQDGIYTITVEATGLRYGTTATESFQVTVLPSIPTIGTFTSDRAAITSTNGTGTIALTISGLANVSDLANVSFVEIWRDENNNDEIDPGIDQQLTPVEYNTTNETYFWAGPLNNLIVGKTETFLALAVHTGGGTSYSDVVTLSVPVIANQSVATVAYPVGLETEVNPPGIDNQNLPLVGYDQAGNSAAFYYDAGSNQTDFQRYNPAGAAMGPLKPFPLSQVNGPAYDMAMLPDGFFVIVWLGPNDDLRAKEFNADGMAYTGFGNPDYLEVDSYLGVNSQNAFDYEARVAISSPGEFAVVVSHDPASSAQSVFYRFSGGVASGSYVLDGGKQCGNATVGMDAGGAAIVGWIDEQSGSVQAQTVNQNGAPVGNVVTVSTLGNAVTQTGADNLTVAVDEQGRYVFVWTASAGTSESIFARRFLADGTAVDAAEFRVNDTEASDDDFNPRVSFRQGQFVVTWTNTSVGSLQEVFAQAYSWDNTLRPLGGNFEPAINLHGDLLQPVVAIDYTGTNFLVAWTGVTSSFAAYFQRYSTLNATPSGFGLQAFPPQTTSLLTIPASPTAAAPLGFFEDPSPGNWTFSLVSGPGSTDNASFQIINGQLSMTQSGVTNSLKAHYSLLVLATPDTGVPVEQEFNLTTALAGPINFGQLLPSRAYAYATAFQSNGQVVVVGKDGIGLSETALARYNPDGSLDPSFGGTGGVVTHALDGFNYATGVAVQSNGQIVVVGYGLDPVAIPNFIFVARYNADGSLDPSFGNGGITRDPFGGSVGTTPVVAVQNDGEIVIADYSASGGINEVMVAGYTPAGTLDPAFGSAGTTALLIESHDTVSAVAIQPDGKIVVAGTDSNGVHAHPFVARFLANGNLDPSFNSVGYSSIDTLPGNNYGYSVAVQPDGKFLIAGSFGLLRLTPNGSLDTTFNGTGLVTTKSGSTPVVPLSAVVVEPDGKILVAGSASNGTNSDFVFIRYTASGAVDMLQTKDFGGNDYAEALALSSNAQAVLAGDTTVGAGDDFAVWQLNLNSPPTASIAGLSSAVPGQSLTYTIGALEPSLNADKAGFTYQVNWGDNTPAQTVTGLDSLQVSHTYASNGSYTMQVSATDQNDLTSAVATLPVSITTTALEPEPTNASEMALMLGLTSGATSVVIAAGSSPGTVVLYLNGSSQGQLTVNGSVDVFTSGGNNTVWLSPQISVPTLLNGVALAPAASPIVVAVSPDPTAGILPAGTASIQITFPEPMVGADQAGSYQFQSLGPDGLLGTVDDVLVPLSVSYNGTVATLTFSPLPASVYRFTVKTAITDAAGNQLNSTGNGAAGSSYVRDFVATSNPVVSQTSPRGFTFDVQSGGVGGGQLVQGTNNAFDGLNRLQVGGVDYSPSLPTYSSPAEQEQALGSFFQTNSTTPVAVSGLTETFTTSGGPVRLASQLSVYSPPAANNLVGAQLVVDGALIGAPQYAGAADAASGQQNLTFDLTGYLTTLTAGSHTIGVDVWTTTGQTIYLFGSSQGSQNQVSATEVGSIPGVGLAETAHEQDLAAAFQSSSTTPVPVSGLSETFTTNGGPIRLSAELTAYLPTTNNAGEAQLVIDGVLVGNPQIAGSSTAGMSQQYVTFDLAAYLPILTAGSHTVGVNVWSAAGQPISLDNHWQNHLSAVEINAAPGGALSEVSHEQDLATTFQIGSLALVPGLSETITTSGGPVRLSAELTALIPTNLNEVIAQLLLDGSAVGSAQASGAKSYNTGPQYATLDLETYLSTLAAGTHTVSVEIVSQSGDPSSLPGTVLNHISAVEYPTIALPDLANGGLTVVTPSQTLAGLTVHREVTVPNTGSQDFARTVEVFQNPTASAITTTVHLVGNLGSDTATQVFATSSGDSTPSINDEWFGTDGGPGTTAVISILHGLAGLQPTAVNVIGDNIEWTYNITVPANQTLELGTFTIQASSEANAVAEAKALVTSGGQTAEFLSSSDIASLANYTATHFVVGASSGGGAAGTALNFTVTAEDQFNNTETAYHGTVVITSSDGQAVLPSNFMLTSGVGTFSVTLKTAGAQTVTATDTTTSSITGTSGGVAVSAAAASQLVVSGPTSATAGTAFLIRVTAEDPFNNTATTYGGTVHFSTTDSRTALAINSTLSGGTRLFFETLKTSGNQTVTATDTVNSSITGTSAAVAVSPAAASQLVVSAPTSATAGTAILLRVTAEDPFNNTATTYGGTIHFSTTDAQTRLTIDSTLSSGTGLFFETLKTSGNQTVTATDTVTSSITGTSAAVAVSATAATHFVVVASSGSVTAGAVLNFTVTAEDRYNNTATSYGGTVAITSSDSQAGLPNNNTLTSGTGTFSLTLATAGAQTVTATDTVASSITGTTSLQVVAKVPATISLSNLGATYDGNDHGATATTTPSGLTVSFAYGQGGNPVASPTNAGSYDVQATINDNNYQGSASGTLVIAKGTPVITWSNPADFTFGTALGSTQLNATADVAGSSFVYNPAAGAVLNAGTNQTLTVTFTPTDTTDYNTATKNISINVNMAGTTTTASAASALFSSASQNVTLSASVAPSSGLGTFNEGTVTFSVFNSTGTTQIGSSVTSGTIAAGSASAVFSLPGNTALGSYQVHALYNPGSDFTGSSDNSKTLTVNGLTTTVQPTTVTTAYSTKAQTLTLTGNVLSNGGPVNGGLFAFGVGDFAPVTSGTVTNGTASATFILPAGTNAQTLTIITAYSGSGSFPANIDTTGALTVTRATLTITWKNPANITYGTKLGATQLDAASVAGTFLYTPAVGTLLGAGNNQTLTVTFTPTNTTDYTSTTKSVTINVLPATLTVTTTSKSKTYGTTFTAFTGTLSGLKNGDNITLAGFSSVGSAATATVVGGPYTISATLNDPGSKLANYTIITHYGTLTVSKAPLAITANTAHKAYGQTLTFAGTEFTTSGLMNGDAVTSVTLTSTGAAATATVAGSPNTIVASAATGTGLSNYTVSYKVGHLTVSRATPTFSNLTSPAIIHGNNVSATISGQVAANTTNATGSVVITILVNGIKLTKTVSLDANGSFSTGFTRNWTGGSYTVSYHYASTSNFNAITPDGGTILVVS